jgi:hypothetical protein
VPLRPAIPDTAVAAVRRFCEDRIPAQHQDKIRVEYGLRGKTVTIYECRPPWRPDLGTDWTRQPVAQLRYDPEDHHWRLYCADRSSRWHYYDLTDPSPDINELIEEINDDPTGIFWG